MKNIFLIFILAAVVTLSGLSAAAGQNILRGINIKSASASYTIELTADAPVSMTKRIVSANRIIIHLKNISIADNLTSKFARNAVIDNIMIEPLSRNATDIIIQGKNIAYSSIEFRTPSAAEIASGSVYSYLTGAAAHGVNRYIQFGILLLFGIILFCEIRFIKSKYDELRAERQFILADTENTGDFKDLMPGYGFSGIKKPYTTPIYGTNIRNALIKNKNLKVPETTTLSMLLKLNNEKIFSRVEPAANTSADTANITKKTTKTEKLFATIPAELAKYYTKTPKTAVNFEV